MPPMLAVPMQRPRVDAGWVYELKYDGVRALVHVDAGRLRILSRSGRDMTDSFAELGPLPERLHASSAVLDGELVGLDDDGLPSFSLVMSRLRSRGGRGGEGALQLHLFDALKFGGDDLRDEPLGRRKEVLLDGVRWGGAIRYSSHVPGRRGLDLLRRADLRGFEGVVAKAIDSTYVHGRSDSWRKIRLTASARVLACGLARAEAQGEWVLLVGVYGPGGELKYVGRVLIPPSYSGDIEELHDAARQHPGEDSPFPGDPEVTGPVMWLDPVRSCRVEYAEITAGGRLRHPAYRGLIPTRRTRCLWSRLDRNRASRPGPQQKGHLPTAELLARMGVPAGENETTCGGRGRRVKLTNLDKVLCPEPRLTKADFIAYYHLVAPALLDYLSGRPLVLTRYPDGVHQPGFYQKRAPPTRPSWVPTVPVGTSSGTRDYVVCDDVSTLMWLVNSAAFEIHPLPVQDPERVDLMVIDLDPRPPAGGAEARRAAVLVEQLLGELDVPSWVKTSGGKGLHVVVPLKPDATAEQVTTLAQIIGGVLSRQREDLFTVQRSKTAGAGRVYVDYLQNRRGATVVAPYCVRGGPGAVVSMPLTWGELFGGIRWEPVPSFSMSRAAGRFLDRGDAWSGMFDERGRIGDLLQKLRERFGGR